MTQRFRVDSNAPSKGTALRSLNINLFPSCAALPKALLHKYLKMSLFLCCNLQVQGSQTDAKMAAPNQLLQSPCSTTEIN